MARRRGPSQRPETWRYNHSSPLANGLVFAHLGQHVGSTMYKDASPYNADGTLTGYTGAGNLPQDRWGWSGYLKRPILGLNGSSDYVDFSSTVSSLYRFTSERFWCSYWIYWSANTIVPFGVGEYLVGGWYTYVGSDDAIWINTQTSGVQSTVKTSAAFGTGTLRHLLFQRTSATAASIYVNGISQSVTGSITNPATTTRNLRIGAYSAASSSFVNGYMADVMCGIGDVSGLAAQIADPSNVDLRIGATPLLLPVRRYWGAGFNLPSTFWHPDPSMSGGFSEMGF